MLLLAACGRAQETERSGRDVRSAAARRTVAVTIDDLPAVRGHDLETVRAMTEDLLDGLARNEIPVVGFVNEVKLAVPGEESRRADLLEAWLDAGHDLGNHTYSHPWLYDTPLQEFEADVVRGEAVTSRLLAERGRRLRYFRHPRLNTGPDIETRAAFETFLAQRGYTIAPVTIDNDEYLYALAYYEASVAGDSALMARIGRDYVRYMAEVFEFYETLSRELLRREPAQVLLIHANLLNAAYLDDLAEMLRARGYAFVSLDAALEDPAYDLPDEYVGRKGLSWLMRWAITMGVEPGEQPSYAGEYSQTEITVTPVRGGVHLVSGVGGNIAAFVGEDGVLLVDAGLSQLSDRLLVSIHELCERESANPALRYVVNTHWHSDHTGGNEALAAAGALVVAHENVLRLLSQDQVMAHLGDRLVPAAPVRARPRLTFNDRINLSWNQDLIHVVHIPNAHSNGDVIVHFRDADVIHMGDILNGHYPFIDLDFDGQVGGIIRAVEEVVAHSRESTLFIPGHGPVADREGLLRYRDMLTTVRDRVQAMIERGMTRQEVIEAKPTADLDAEWSGEESADPFVGLVYDGLVGSGS